jgi:hypothetical protein
MGRFLTKLQYSFISYFFAYIFGAFSGVNKKLSSYFLKRVRGKKTQADKMGCSYKLLPEPNYHIPQLNSPLQAEISFSRAKIPFT